MAFNKNIRIFTDLDLNFSKHPITNDIVKVNDENAINRSIRNLVSTNFNERPFQPYKAGNVIALLFEPITELSAYDIKSAIEEVITNYEPRCNLTEVQVIPNPERNGYQVSIYYHPENLPNPEQLDIFLEKVR
jgi:phage baseplate assembly protein W